MSFFNNNKTSKEIRRCEKLSKGYNEKLCKFRVVTKILEKKDLHWSGKIA